MLRWLCLGLLAAAAALAVPALGAAAEGQPGAEEPRQSAAADAALQVMQAFLAAFNARDEKAWADTLVYPHVRIASGGVVVYPSREAFVADHDLERFAAQTGWHHSTWDDLRVVQESPTKVHVAVIFSRYRADGSRLASYHSLYVIEQVDGRWGVRARSSFAP